MTKGNTSLLIELPIPEAGELAAMSAQLGISLQKYLGYHVLCAAYGPMHPQVAAFYAAHIGKRGE